MSDTDVHARTRAMLLDVVRPTLTLIGLGGLAAEQLVVGTALQETQFLTRHQTGGPALGYWQMEQRTYLDVVRWLLLPFHDWLWRRCQPLVAEADVQDPQLLVANDAWACAMCRLLYFRVPAPLPAADDIAAQSLFYKKFYNTWAGKATTDEYLAHWQAAVTPETFEILEP